MNSFTYKDQEIKFHMGIFQFFSTYFSGKKIEPNTSIPLLNDDEDDSDITIDTAKDFVAICQNQSIEITKKNVTGLHKLAMKYEVQKVKDETEKFIFDHKKEHLVQFLLMNIQGKSSNYKSEELEDLISKNFIEYIKDNQLLELPFPVLYRIVTNYELKYCNQSEKPQEFIDFLFKCLNKFEKRASILFKNINVSETKNIIGRLLEYADKFDFIYINKNHLKTVYDIQNRILEKEESLKKQQTESNEQMLKMKNQNDELKNEIEKMKLLLDEKNKENDEKINQFQLIIDGFKQQMDQKLQLQQNLFNEELNNIKKLLEEKNKQYDEKLLQQEKQFNEQITNINQNQTVTRNEVDQISQKQEETKNEIDQLKQQHNETKNEVDQFKQQQTATKNEIDQLKQQYNETKTEVDQIKQQQAATKNEIDQFKQQQNETRNEIDQFKQQQTATKNEIDQIKQRQEDIKTEIDQFKKQTATKNEIDQLKQKQEDVKTEINQFIQKQEGTNQQFQTDISQQNITEQVTQQKNILSEIKKLPISRPFAGESLPKGIIYFLGDSISLSAGGKHNSIHPLTNIKKFNDKNFFNYDRYIPVSESDSYIEFDFGQSKKIDLFSYLIRSTNGDESFYHPKSWRIEGSNDKISWNCLDHRKDDQNLRGKLKLHCFQCENNKNENNKFRYIRYVQEDSWWKDCPYYVNITYFELYGDIFNIE